MAGMDGPMEDRMVPVKPGMNPDEAGMRGTMPAHQPALGAALRRLEPGDGHLTPAMVRALVAERRERGDAWDMPDHLAACPECLEAFAAMLESEASPSSDCVDGWRTRVAARLHRDTPRDDTVPRIITMPRRAFSWLDAAGAAVLAAACAALFVFLVQVPAADRVSGFFAPAIAQLTDGSLIEPGRVMVPAVDATATLVDGTRVHIAADSSFAIRQRDDGVSVDLMRGSVVASVGRQQGGNRFSVRTALGEAMAIGACFRVHCETVAGAAPDALPVRMSVDVVEGTVRVVSALRERVLEAGATHLIDAAEGRYEPKAAVVGRLTP